VQHQCLHQMCNSFFNLSSHIWELCKQSLLQSGSVHYFTTHNSKLLHPGCVKVGHISKFKNWCSACFQASFFNIHNKFSKYNSGYFIIFIIGLLLSCLHLHYTVVETRRHLVWYFASKATMSPKLSLAKSKLSLVNAALWRTRWST